MAPGFSLPRSRVDPKHYTLKYYLTDCSGYELFKKTSGNELDERLTYITKHLPIKSGMKLLDIGCGRGELAIWLAKKGCKVTGIDYSSAAIKLATAAKSKQNKLIQQGIDFKRMDINNLDFPKSRFDGAILTEVLEHIYPHEQQELLKQLSLILKPNAFIFFHTSPSRWFNDYAYRYWCHPVSTILVSIWNRVFKKKYGNIPSWENLRTHYHKLMHVNEPDYFSLKLLFSMFGYRGEINSSNITVAKPVLSWKDSLYNFLVYLIPLSRKFPLNVYFGADFYATMRKK